MLPADWIPADRVPRLPPAAAAAVFLFFTAWFCLLLFTLLPLLKARFAWRPSPYRFVTGSCLFAPLLPFQPRAVLDFWGRLG